MFAVNLQNEVGSVEVQTTENRGHTPEELAAFAVKKIIEISDDADPVLKEQAVAFRERMYWVIVHTARQAILSDRTTLANQAERQGQIELANILRNL
tara:strand:+ start:7089 stop:7379 length:291 start_codon:yes stop_codon:yes gene_type:complete